MDVAGRRLQVVVRWLRRAAVPAAAISAGVCAQNYSHTSRRPTFLRPRTGALLDV